MKKMAFWTAGGVGLAVVCGLAGLAHLSASVFTVTVFCATPALIVATLETFKGKSRSI